MAILEILNGAGPGIKSEWVTDRCVNRQIIAQFLMITQHYTNSLVARGCDESYINFRLFIRERMIPSLETLLDQQKIFQQRRILEIVFYSIPFTEKANEMDILFQFEGLDYTRLLELDDKYQVLVFAFGINNHNQLLEPIPFYSRKSREALIQYSKSEAIKLISNISQKSKQGKLDGK